MKNKRNFNTAVWNANVPAPTYPKLNSNLEVDAVIVGGGITGITAAYLLAANGKNVVVLEARHIGNGSTAFSTGNLYATVGERLSRIQKKHGKDTMIEVVKSRNAAIDFIESTILKHDINCGYQRVPWHLFSTDAVLEQNSEIQMELEAGREANLQASNNRPSIFPFSNVTEITTFEHQGQFNAYQYVLALAALADSSNCKIFQDTSVLKIEDGNPCIVYTAQHTVRSKHIIMATHSPKGIYQVHTEMKAYREFAIAAELNQPLPSGAIYWNLTRSGQYSVRPYSNEEGDYLVVLGEPYPVGTLDNNKNCLSNIEQYLHRNFDVKRIAYRWAAQNYKSADGLPYIGTSALQSNTYIATGFKADGLVYGTLASMLITDDILGKNNHWLRLYNPVRFTP